MIDYTPSTALIVVDVQNDFADRAGALYVGGGEAVIAGINDEIGSAQAAHAFVVYTQDWHPEHTPHFEVDGGIWPVHCVRDTWGAAFHPQLLVTGPVVRKGTDGADGYSGFCVRDAETQVTRPTTLSRLLRERAIEHVVVVGLATDYCVCETALDAARLGFRTTVLRRAIRAVDLTPGDGERAIEAMRAAGIEVG